MALSFGRPARASSEGAQREGPLLPHLRGDQEGTGSYTEPRSEKDALLNLPGGVGLSTAVRGNSVWEQEEGLSAGSE